jgi:uncharacterized membrane protein YbhN (UPF0104 family)
VLLLRKEEPDLGRLVAVVVVDKWVGLCALLGLGCFGLLWSRPPVPLGIYALILLGGVGIFLLLWPLRMSFVLRWLKVGVLWLSERVGRESLGRKLLVLFETWQKEVQNTRLLGKALFWGAVYHGLAGAFFFVLALSCGVHVAFLDWLWIFSLLSLVLFLPISLGGLGLREGTLVGVLHWLGIPSPLAMSFAFALLGITLFHALLGGVWAQKVAWEERLAAKES